MQHFDLLTTLEALGAAVTFLGGLYTLIKHLSSSSKKKKEKYRQAIIDQAKQEMELIKLQLEDKISKVEKELDVQKENVSKDLGHLKEIYSAEITVLGEKIENLRQDLGVQHSNLVALLTRLVESR